MDSKSMTTTNEKRDFVNINKSKYEIHFNAEINEKSISMLIENLLLLEEIISKKNKEILKSIDKLKNDDNYINEYEKFKISVELPPIKLYITSNGGIIYQVFTAIDTIQELKVPVHTICKGFVASAGTLLSVVGKKRFITENTFMLIHELRGGVWGTYSSMVDSLESSKQLMEHIKSYYIKKTKITSEELEEQLKKDVTWNATKCLEKGFVDEIIKF